MAILHNWQIYMVGYLLFMAIFCHSYKEAVQRCANETASTILLQIVGATSILFLVPTAPLTWPSVPSHYLLLILASVFYAINNRLQTSARKNLEVSTFSVISQLTFVFLTMLGFIFLRESVLPAKIGAICLILIGNCLILIKSKGFNINKYVITAIWASLAASLGVFVSVGVSKGFNLPLYISLTFIFPALVLKSFKRVMIKEIVEEYKQGKVGAYLTAGVSWGLAIYCSLKAMQMGQVSVVAPLQAGSVLINVITAYIFLDERGAIYRKIAAAALIILGIYTNVR